MKKVITRLFSDKGNAKTVARRLLRQGFPREAVMLVHSDSDVAATLIAADVNADTAQGYASKIGDGAVLCVSATYKPLGAAKIARTEMAKFDTTDMGDHAEEVRIKDFVGIGDRSRNRLLSNSLGLPLIEHRRWGSVDQKDYMIQTGVRWGSFGGKKNMIQTGKRWGSFGGMSNMIQTGRRWGSFGGKKNMIQTGKRWGSFGGKENMIQTGKRWGGPAPTLMARSGMSGLMTGKRWGGPVPLISK